MNERLEQYKVQNSQENLVLVAMDLYYKQKLYSKFSSSCLNKHSVISDKDEDRLKFQSIFQQVKNTKSPQPLLD